MSDRFTLVSTGDLAPRYPLSDLKRPTSELWECLRSADLTMANLELPLTTEDTPTDKAITLRADPNIAPSLRESLGNFLFHSMGKSGGLRLGDNYPPYNLETLRTGEALETVVLQVEVEEDHMKEARFLPARMDDNGEPELLNGTDSHAVLRRLVESSSRLDAPMELLDDQAVMRM